MNRRQIYNVIMSLYKSMVCLHLQCSVHFWSFLKQTEQNWKRYRQGQHCRSKVWMSSVQETTKRTRTLQAGEKVAQSKSDKEDVMWDQLLVFMSLKSCHTCHTQFKTNKTKSFLKHLWNLSLKEATDYHCGQGVCILLEGEFPERD